MHAQILLGRQEPKHLASRGLDRDEQTRCARAVDDRNVQLAVDILQSLLPIRGFGIDLTQAGNTDFVDCPVKRAAQYESMRVIRMKYEIGKAFRRLNVQGFNPTGNVPELRPTGTDCRNCLVIRRKGNRAKRSEITFHAGDDIQ